MVRRLLYLIFCFPAFFIGCDDRINTIPHHAFDDIGNLHDSIINEFYRITPPKEVQIYIEASGSMNGLFKGGHATRFKRDMWNFISKYNQINDSIYLFVDGKSSIRKLSRNDFYKQMNSGSLTSANFTIVPDMLSKMVEDLDNGKSEVAILISDMKYSPQGNVKVELNQYQTNVRNLFKDKDYTVSIIGLESEFIKSNGQIEDEFPYYLIVVGNPDKAGWVRNQIWETLQSEIKGSIDYNINYSIPAYSALPTTKLLGMSPNMLQDNINTSCYSFVSYNTMDDYAECVVAINYEHLPSDVSKNLTTASFVCKSYTNLSQVDWELLEDCKPTETNILSNINPTVYLKTRLSKMTTECDGITIELAPISKNKEWIEKYYGALLERETDKTISIEEFVGGLDEAYPNYSLQATPLHILISQK